MLVYSELTNGKSNFVFIFFKLISAEINIKC